MDGSGPSATGAPFRGGRPSPWHCRKRNDSQDFALGHTHAAQQFGFLTGYPLTHQVVGAAYHVDQQRAHGCSINISLNLALIDVLLLGLQIVMNL